MLKPILFVNTELCISFILLFFAYVFQIFHMLFHVYFLCFRSRSFKCTTVELWGTKGISFEGEESNIKSEIRKLMLVCFGVLDMGRAYTVTYECYLTSGM